MKSSMKNLGRKSPRSNRREGERLVRATEDYIKEDIYTFPEK